MNRSIGINGSYALPGRGKDNHGVIIIHRRAVGAYQKLTGKVITIAGKLGVYNVSEINFGSGSLEVRAGKELESIFPGLVAQPEAIFNVGGFWSCDRVSDMLTVRRNSIAEGIARPFALFKFTYLG